MAGYEPHENCGGEVIDGKPHYIPLGKDTVLEIIDQTCRKCGAVIIGEHQRTRQIVNEKAHDKLIELLEKRVR